MAERKINGREFQVGEVLATEALRLKFQLMKFIGSGVDELPEILQGVSGNSEEQQAKSRAAAVKAISGIFSNCDPEEAVQLLSSIVSIASVKRPSGVFEQVDLDADFTRDNSSLYPVVFFVLQKVFSDFFTGLSGNGTTKKARTGTV